MIRSALKWSIGCILLLAILFFAAFAYLYYSDYTKSFQQTHGTLAHILERPETLAGKYWVTLQNNSGFTVECGLLTPQCQRNHKGRTAKRYPAILLLGGKATGKYAIDYAMDIDSVLLLALDYPYEPRETYSFWTIAQDIPALRQALLDMVPSAMLAIDYLTQRPDVDTAKIVMLGYSFGAPFVPAVSSLDRRVTMAAMVYGGGDLTSLIRHNMRRFEGVLLSEFVAQSGGLLLRPIEPMRFAEQLSPTPLLMINGLNDEQIPCANTELFYQAAKEPKKLVWLDSKHVNPDNPELTRRIVATLKHELKLQGIL